MKDQTGINAYNEMLRLFLAAKLGFCGITQFHWTSKWMDQPIDSFAPHQNVIDGVLQQGTDRINTYNEVIRLSLGVVLGCFEGWHHLRSAKIGVFHHLLLFLPYGSPRYLLLLCYNLSERNSVAYITYAD